MVKLRGVRSVVSPTENSLLNPLDSKNNMADFLADFEITIKSFT
jgi:hypothetical protein